MVNKEHASVITFSVQSLRQNFINTSDSYIYLFKKVPQKGHKYKKVLHSLYLKMYFLIFYVIKPMFSYNVKHVLDWFIILCLKVLLRELDKICSEM